MIDCVKGGGEVKKNQSRNTLQIHGATEIVMDSDKSGFSGVEFPIGRLKW